MRSHVRDTDSSRDHRSTVASFHMTREAASSSSPSGSLLSPPTPGTTRSRTQSVSSSLSWSQQQPLLHIHLMFVILITASIWTYCMSRSDLLSHSSLFRVSPNTHLLSHLYHQHQFQVKSPVNSGAVSVLADVPSSSGLADEATGVLSGPTTANQHRNSFSWSSSPYPSGTTLPLNVTSSNDPSCRRQTTVTESRVTKSPRMKPSAGSTVN